MKNKGLSFSEAIDRATVGYGSGGIGTFSEKILHRTIKFYFEPDEANHEVEYQGAVIDILGDQGIIEIQTRSFNKLAQKLEKFLPENNVTVVYPIIETRKICRVDTLTGERRPPRKSPKKGRASDALLELGRIRKFIPDKNLTVVIVFVDVIETRMLAPASISSGALLSLIPPSTWISILILRFIHSALSFLTFSMVSGISF